MLVILLELVLAFIGAYLFPVWISDNTLSFTNSIFSVLLFAVLFMLFRFVQRKKPGLRAWICALIPGGLFSFFTASGISLQKYNSIRLVQHAKSILFFTLPMACLLLALWYFFRRAEETLANGPHSGVLKLVQRGMVFLLRHRILIFSFLFLCWIPALLADFPGGFRYDATHQLWQIYDGYNGNYPLLHSLIINGLMVTFRQMTGSWNTGVTVYVVLQMIFMAWVYTSMLDVFYRQGKSPLLLLCVLLYACFFPIIQILVVQEVRDVMFGTLLTDALFQLYRLSSDRQEYLSRKRNWLHLAVVLPAAILSRNNNAGLVALIILVMIALVLFLRNRKTDWKKAAVLSMAVMIVFGGLAGILNWACSPKGTVSIRGSLSLLAQPLARAATREKKDFSEEELEELADFVDMEKFAYSPEYADNAKNSLKVDGRMKEFLSFWLRIGMKHKTAYIDAVLYHTRSLWDPSDIVDGYNKARLPDYKGFQKSYYGITEEKAEPVVGETKNKDLEKYFTKIGLFQSFEKIPVVSMLFSIGFAFWFIVQCFFYSASRKSCQTSSVLLLLVYGILSAAAPVMLLRYFCGFFLAMPMILVFAFQPAGKTAAEAPREEVESLRSIFRRHRDSFVRWWTPERKEMLWKSLALISAAGFFFFIFLVLLGREPSGWLAVLAAAISLGLALLVKKWKHPAWMETRVFPIAFGGILAVFEFYVLLCGWTRISAACPIPVQDIGNVLIQVIRVVGLLLAVFQVQRNRQRGIFLFFATVLLYFPYRKSGLDFPLYMTGMVLLSDMLPAPRKRAKIILFSILVYIVVLAVFFQNRWVENRFFTRTTRVVQTFGMAHSNSVAMVLMILCMLIWYVWLQKHSILALPLMFGAGWVIWKLTESRSAAMIVLGLASIQLLWALLRCIKKEKALIPLAFLPIVLMVISLYLWNNVLKIQEIMGDRNFVARFTIPQEAIKTYSLHLLGNRMQYMYALDNAYLYLLIMGGILVTLWNMGFFTVVGVCLVRTEQYAALILFALFLLYGIMENVTWMAYCNFSLLLMDASTLTAKESSNLSGGVENPA